ncbi:MAG: DUF3383 domain-containing protein [Lachnospiraceae bacterium]|nr:DUF3383 domain-containing protein [Lachnospiraceae bacterium]
MGNNYDQIATVTIDIATTLVDSTSFDYILIVGPLPATAPATAPAKCGSYSSIDEVTEAGWVTTGDDADPVGVAARIAFSQDPTPTKIYIAPIQEVEGVAESAVDTLQRAISTSGWYVVCPAGIEDDELEEMAEYIETQDKLMAYTELKFFEAGDDGEDASTVSNIYLRTFGVYGRESTDQADEDVPEANKYINVAYTVAWLANESGSETAAFKTLSSVYPAELTSSEQTRLKEGCINYFITVGSKNVTMLGKVLGDEWCDIIRFRDWLKNDMQVELVSLFLKLPKVPYTDGGITLIQNVMESSLQRGQVAGGICETEYDDDGNEIPGYKVSVPSAIDISDSQKASRELTDCKFTARLAGAIHFAEITGTLAYSL